MNPKLSLLLGHLTSDRGKSDVKGQALAPTESSPSWLQLLYAFSIYPTLSSPAATPILSVQISKVETRNLQASNQYGTFEHFQIYKIISPKLLLCVPMRGTWIQCSLG